MESDNDHPDRRTCYSPRFAAKVAHNHAFSLRNEAPLGLELLEPSETDKDAARDVSHVVTDRIARFLRQKLPWIICPLWTRRSAISFVAS